VTPPPRPTLFPYTTLFRSRAGPRTARTARRAAARQADPRRRSARLSAARDRSAAGGQRHVAGSIADGALRAPVDLAALLAPDRRSEEHTSELQSPYDLVCR